MEDKNIKQEETTEWKKPNIGFLLEANLNALYKACTMSVNDKTRAPITYVFIRGLKGSKVLEVFSINGDEACKSELPARFQGLDGNGFAVAFECGTLNFALKELLEDNLDGGKILCHAFPMYEGAQEEVVFSTIYGSRDVSAIELGERENRAIEDFCSIDGSNGCYKKICLDKSEVEKMLQTMETSGNHKVLLCIGNTAYDKTFAVSTGNNGAMGMEIIKTETPYMKGIC